MSTHSSTARRRRSATHKQTRRTHEQRPTLQVAANRPATPQPQQVTPAPPPATSELQHASASPGASLSGSQRSLAAAAAQSSPRSFVTQRPEPPERPSLPEVTIRRRTDAPRTVDEQPTTGTTGTFAAASLRPPAPSRRLALLAATNRLLSRRSAFSPTERDWRRTLWGRRARLMPGVIAGFAALLVILTLSFALAIRTSNSKQAQLLAQITNAQTHSSKNNSGGILVKQSSANGQPTPVAATYSIGAWVSDNAPPASGTVRVYVRVSQGIKPVANVTVTLSVRFAYSTTVLSPQTTNADGMVTFTVFYSNAPKDKPVFATAQATVGSQTVTHQATFFPH